MNTSQKFRSNNAYDILKEQTQKVFCNDERVHLFLIGKDATTKEKKNIISVIFI